MDKSQDPDQAIVPSRTPGPSSIESRVTDFARLGVLALFAYLSLKLVTPFALIAVWASILTVALYPLYRFLRMLLGGRPRLAAATITLLALVVIAGPLAAIVVDFAEAAQAIFAKLEGGKLVVPPPSENVRNWPLVGDWVYGTWAQASVNIDASLKRFAPYLLKASGVVVEKIAGFGVDMLGFIAAVIASGFLFVPGPRLGEGAAAIARRLAGDRGAGFVNLAASTIRNVARGVIGVAAVQAMLSAVVLAIFDVPAPGVLAFVILILCIVQIGPALVLLPVAIWAWMTMDTASAVVFSALLVPIILIDNIAKPILVARGLSTPILVILAGVIGGTLSYGLIGLFLGPVVLSVFYDLVLTWLRDVPPRNGAPPTP
ncbi:AI-2E family transporter [Sinorhizobium sp. BG8]|uniref:AI-2E family transporter n=1 Tax=Sinorhizobium sp. BG8 TaxID=2613773 RepID=UPI00193D789A|nr:AI-2E family transporter [Sinorhizobium sp. BG8]QRM55465.1 AI-2E family transporter [Sinorhizobium sp. BG8]